MYQEIRWPTILQTPDYSPAISWYQTLHCHRLDYRCFSKTLNLNNCSTLVKRRVLCLVLKKLNFEKLDVPVDIYAMGSSLFANEWGREWNIFHQIAQVKLNLVWRAMSKVGRNRGHNRDLKPVSWVLHKSVLQSVNSN